MEEQEIQVNDQDQLIELIGIYGESYLIKYLSESLLNKERIIKEHNFN